MNSQVSEVANSWLLWVACIPVIITVFVQAFSFTKKVKDNAPLVGLSDDDIKKAFRVGALSSIGPALGVFLVMLGLMSIIGGPLAWMRLSVIGAAPTELTAAQMAAESMGTTVGSPDYNVIHFAGAAWIMAMNGSGWLIFSGLFADKLHIINDKISGDNEKLTVAVATAATCGAMAYLVGVNLTEIDGKFASAICAGISMTILTKLAEKMPKLREYNLGISMIFGMIGAVVFNRIGG